MGECARHNRSNYANYFKSGELAIYINGYLGKRGPIMMIHTPDNGDMSFNYENNVLTVFFDIPDMP